MKIFFVAFFWFIQTSPVWAQATFESTKAATIKEMVTGCSNSVLEPNVKRFMDRAKAEGKPFKDEAALKKSFSNPQFKAEVEKMRPAAVAMCRCVLVATIQKVEAAKTQTEVDDAVKNMKPDRSVIAECDKKYMSSVK